jgi:hypothetical protein
MTAIIAVPPPEILPLFPSSKPAALKFPVRAGLRVR